MGAAPSEGENEANNFVKSGRGELSGALPPSRGPNGAKTVVKSMILASQKRRGFFRRPPVGARVLVRGVVV
eukprot:4807472-Pyramimonas_sp.AAC.1